MIFIPKHFRLQELVSPVVWDQYNERAWQFLDPYAVFSLDRIRERLGKQIVVNNWHADGEYKDSGLRIFDSKIGARNSLHKFGKAFDIKVAGEHPNDIAAFLVKNATCWPDVTTIESPAYTPTWTHFDTRWRPTRMAFEIQMVQP